MIDARLDARLRGLPGVLDCSVIDGGVALLVHPEVDARVLKAKAQAVMAELADPRPLVVLGGIAPPAPEPASPFSLGLFVVVVLCLLAVLPNASGTRPRPTFQGPLAAAALDGGITPDLARPRLSIELAAGAAARRATRALADELLAASGPAPAVAVADAAAPAPSDHGRQGATARLHAAVPVHAPTVPPAVSTLTIVRAVDVPQPGRSGDHRRFPKP